MKQVATKDAVGMVLAHDVTEIVRGERKGVLFPKGHVVRAEDIEKLLRIGKDSLYLWEKDDSMLHENEAAEILCELSMGANMEKSEPREGKISLTASCDGLLKVKKQALWTLNSFGEMMLATTAGNFPVKKGQNLAGMRIIPLVIQKEKMEKARAAVRQVTGGQPILDLLPFHRKRIGLITTGNEVFYGRIKDTFTPVIKEKFLAYDSEIVCHKIFPDDADGITGAILDMIEAGCEVVCCTGGMSVDPDDRTPLAIKNTGARIVSYGAPVLPGAMFLLAYYEKGGKSVPILGLPGCVMYHKRTIFDLVLPRIMAEDEIVEEELFHLGEGGLCQNCEVCHFPACGFGKGW